MAALYESGVPPEPHRFQPGDWVCVRRHRQGALEPRWKGPAVILLTVPTVTNVVGIVTWIHYTHARPADLFTLKEDYRGWEVAKDQAIHSNSGFDEVPSGSNITVIPSIPVDLC